MGLLGGAAAESLKWYSVREELYKGVPDYAKSCWYWLVTLVMVVFGGVLVLAYQHSEGVTLNLVLAFNIGASAPLIISQIPAVNPGNIN